MFCTHTLPAQSEMQWEFWIFLLKSYLQITICIWNASCSISIGRMVGGGRGRVFWILPDGRKIFKKPTIRKMLRRWFYILIIPKVINKLVKKIVQQKTGNVTFLSENQFVNLSLYIWIFKIFSSFWPSRLSRNLRVIFVNRFLNVGRNFFRKKYHDLIVYKKKKLRELEKNHMDSDKLTNPFWLK